MRCQWLSTAGLGRAAAAVRNARDAGRRVPGGNSPFRHESGMGTLNAACFSDPAFGERTFAVMDQNWFLLAESRLTKRLFAATVRRIAELPLPAE